MSIDYSVDAGLLTASNSVTIELTEFRNPIEVGHKLVGFMITTADDQGYQMDQSSALLEL
jgi:hypothetical protein